MVPNTFLDNEKANEPWERGPTGWKVALEAEVMSEERDQLRDKSGGSQMGNR